MGKKNKSDFYFFSCVSSRKKKKEFCVVPPRTSEINGGWVVRSLAKWNQFPGLIFCMGKKRNNNNNPATEVEVLPSNELVLRESESITEPRALVAVLRELLVATSTL